MPQTSTVRNLLGWVSPLNNAGMVMPESRDRGSLFLALGRALLRAGTLLPGGFLGRNSGALFRNGGGVFAGSGFCVHHGGFR